MFLYFERLVSNTNKNHLKTYSQHLGINLVKYSSRILGHIRKHLGHTGTLTNLQNNCIKLPRFGADITKLFLL